MRRVLELFHFMAPQLNDLQSTRLVDICRTTGLLVGCDTPRMDLSPYALPFAISALLDERVRNRKAMHSPSVPISPTTLRSFSLFSTSQPVVPVVDNREKRLGHPYQSRAQPRNKKPRTSFTKYQIAYLEARFLDQKYLASADRANLAAQLNMSDAQVKTWFQNRRTKWRRQEAEEKEFASKTTKKLLSMTTLSISRTINH